jgi:hypothetical protein
MWNVLTVLRVWYFNYPRQCGMFLLFRLCGILTVPTVSYFNCPGSLVYYLSPTIWHVPTVPTVWYFNCPRQCRMFILFLHCGILTVPDNV